MFSHMLRLVQKVKQKELKNMKTFDLLLKQTNEDKVIEMMQHIESLIYNEIVDIDAITKWYEIEQATLENREIKQIEYEPTSVPQMMINDLNFDRAVKQKIYNMTETLFFNMESKDFDKWVMDLEVLKTL